MKISNRMDLIFPSDDEFMLSRTELSTQQLHALIRYFPSYFVFTGKKTRLSYNPLKPHKLEMKLNVNSRPFADYNYILYTNSTSEIFTVLSAQCGNTLKEKSPRH